MIPASTGAPSSGSCSRRPTIAARVRELGAQITDDLPRRRPAGARAAQGKLHLSERPGARDPPAPPGRFPGRRPATATRWSRAGMCDWCTIRRPNWRVSTFYWWRTSSIPGGRSSRAHGPALATRRPRSLEICALLHKHIAEHLRYPTRFVGFDAPNEFLVGYGLDHAENFRHLPVHRQLAVNGRSQHRGPCAPTPPQEPSTGGASPRRSRSGSS